MVFALEELGRIGTETGREAIFAKGCFVGRVAGWSPKTEDRPCFLMACLAILDFVSCSVNPQVVGSSPTRGAMKRGCIKSPKIKAVSFRNEAHRLFMFYFVTVDNLLSKIERTNYTFSKSSF